MKQTQAQTQKTPKRHIHKFTTRLIEFSDRQVNRAMFVMLLIATTAFVINIPSIVQYFTAQPSSAFDAINPSFPPSIGGEPVPWDKAPWGNGPSDLPPDFYIVISPLEQTVDSTGSVDYIITTIRLNDFGGDISLSTATGNGGALYTEAPITYAGFLDDVLSAEEESTILTVDVANASQNKTIDFEIHGVGKIYGNDELRTSSAILNVIGSFSHPADMIFTQEQYLTATNDNEQVLDVYKEKMLFALVDKDESPGEQVYDLYVYDKDQNNIIQVTTNPVTTSWYSSLRPAAIWGNIVVWIAGDNNLYSYNIQSEESQQLTYSSSVYYHGGVDIYDGKITYFTKIVDFIGADSLVVYDIYQDNIMKQVDISPDYYLVSAKIFKDTIVWSEGSSAIDTNSATVTIYNLITDETIIITKDNLLGDRLMPSYVDIWEDLVIWKNGGYEYMYDISTGETTKLHINVNDSNNDTIPRIYSNFIVYFRLDHSANIPGQMPKYPYLYDIQGNRHYKLTGVYHQKEWFPEGVTVIPHVVINGNSENNFQITSSYRKLGTNSYDLYYIAGKKLIK